MHCATFTANIIKPSDCVIARVGRWYCLWISAYPPVLIARRITREVETAENYCGLHVIMRHLKTAARGWRRYTKLTWQQQQNSLWLKCCFENVPSMLSASPPLCWLPSDKWIFFNFKRVHSSEMYFIIYSIINYQTEFTFTFILHVSQHVVSV